MTKETILNNKIMLEASKLGFIPLRLNSGMAWNGAVVQTKNGVVITNARPIKLLPKGTSDLLFLAPNGKYIFVESKVKPYRPTKKQLDFISMINSNGGIAGVCYSVADFMELVDKL